MTYNVINKLLLIDFFKVYYSAGSGRNAYVLLIITKFYYWRYIMIIEI